MIEPKPITIETPEGKIEFESGVACAEFYGLHVNTVSRYVASGRQNDIPQAIAKREARKGQPIISETDGQEWQSSHAFAKEHGFSACVVIAALGKGKELAGHKLRRK